MVGVLRNVGCFDGCVIGGIGVVVLRGTVIAASFVEEFGAGGCGEEGQTSAEGWT